MTMTDPYTWTVTPNHLCRLVICYKYRSNNYELVHKVVPKPIPVYHLVDLRRLKTVLPVERLFILRALTNASHRFVWNKLEAKYLSNYPELHTSGYEMPCVSNIPMLKEAWKMIVERSRQQ